ncbi:MAG: TIM barrel protein [archaeon]
MAESYEGFYEGAGSTFNSEYRIGYKMPGSHLGFPGSAQTANQLGETMNAIKHGTKTFEVTMVDAAASETIPRQHFEEMRALMKLTGVKPSVHAPILDAAGFGEQGWSPEGREDNERRLFGAIEKAQALDPSGNLPIVLHASNGAPGTEWVPGNEKLGEDKFTMKKATMINQETGQLQAINRDYQFRPGFDPTKSYDANMKEVKGGKPGLLFDAESSIDSANSSDWKNRMTEVAQMTKHVDEIIGSAPINLGDYQKGYIIEGTNHVVELDISERGVGVKKHLGNLDVESGQAGAYNQIRKAGIFLNNAELSFGTAFHQAYKYGTPEQQKELKRLSDNYKAESEKLPGVIPIGDNQNAIDIWAPVRKQELLVRSLGELQKITRGGKTPKVFELSEKFAMEKAANTFGNLAAKSYDKFGEKAPVLAIENMFQGMAFSRAEDMRDLVSKSRENFVKHLVKEGMSENQAKKLAEKKLGVTWDVGHLNIMKKKGFTDKDVIEQTKLISKDKSMVKHVHLTDNFGYQDTHLAPGMGNVPIKAILEELEKTGRLDEMRKIVEAPSMIQHFKVAPHSMTLAAFGSPIYGMKSAGSWDQGFNLQGNYFGGYGNLNPQTHHSYFGAGFTTMPVELGGAMPGGQSRFGGAPMA